MKAVAILSVCLAAAAQQSSQTGEYRVDVNGHRVETNVWDTRSDGTSGQWTVNPSGKAVPLEDVQERVLSQGPDGRIVERITRVFDLDGRPLPPRKTRIEEKRSPDGSSTTLTAEYRTDVNGRTGLWQRSLTSTARTADGFRSETVVERPGLSGGLEVAEKRESVQRKTPSALTEDTVTYRRDANGRFVQAARETAERTEAGGEVVESRAEYATGSSGLELSGQTVSRTRKTSAGEVREVDVFSTHVPTRANVTGRPQLRERQLIETRTVAGGKLETLSVATPSASDPNRLGAYRKVSERMCRGTCDK